MLNPDHGFSHRGFIISLVPPTSLRGKRKPSSIDGEEQETITIMVYSGFLATYVGLCAACVNLSVVGVDTTPPQYKNTKLTDFVECWRHMRWNGNIYAFNADSLSNDSGIPFGPISGTRVTLPWHSSIIR
jgi:hypothetical protein